VFYKDTVSISLVSFIKALSRQQDLYGISNAWNIRSLGGKLPHLQMLLYSKESHPDWRSVWRLSKWINSIWDTEIKLLFNSCVFTKEALPLCSKCHQNFYFISFPSQCPAGWKVTLTLGLVLKKCSYIATNVYNIRYIRNRLHKTDTKIV